MSLLEGPMLVYLAIFGAILTFIGGVLSIRIRVKNENESNRLKSIIKSQQAETIKNIQGEKFPLLYCVIEDISDFALVTFELTNVKKLNIFDVKVSYIDQYEFLTFRLDTEHRYYREFNTAEQKQKILEGYHINYFKRFEFFSISPFEKIPFVKYLLDNSNPIIGCEYEIDVSWRGGMKYKYFVGFEEYITASEEDPNKGVRKWKMSNEYYQFEDEEFNSKDFKKFINQHPLNETQEV